MKKVTYIKEFIFDFAQYVISDASGNKVMLQINYKDNSFKIKEYVVSTTGDFLKEVEDVAKGLLKKKHGVNRAGSVRK